MNTPNVDAGRLERRVRRAGRETMPVFMDFAFYLFYLCGNIRCISIATYHVSSY